MLRNFEFFSLLVALQTSLSLTLVYCQVCSTSENVILDSARDVPRYHNAKLKTWWMCQNCFWYLVHCLTKYVVSLVIRHLHRPEKVKVKLFAHFFLHTIFCKTIFQLHLKNYVFFGFDERKNTFRCYILQNYLIRSTLCWLKYFEVAGCILYNVALSLVINKWNETIIYWCQNCSKYCSMSLWNTIKTWNFVQIVVQRLSIIGRKYSFFSRPHVYSFVPEVICLIIYVQRVIYLYLKLIWSKNCEKIRPRIVKRCLTKG